ncbi:MAG: ABC transporter permease [Thermoanaerobaculales bacterium]|jgi:putative ABC transport system permease protein|nr:ABC transporter permease [Thermoanaerobaculales bacterium]
MAIPISYNVRSVGARWATALVSVLGIAGTVGVFLAMLAMAQGFQATLISSGSPDNAMILRAGADTEMTSAIDNEQVRVIGDASQVARAEDGSPLISPEVVVIGAFPLISTGTDANVQIRGVFERVLEVRPKVEITDGRFFSPGLAELVVGANAVNTYRGFSLGETVDIGGQDWTVVGIFSSGGSAFDSEVWCDANLLNQTFDRSEGIFQSVTARLQSRGDLTAFKDSLTSDPRLTIDVTGEQAYYAKQSEMVSALITGLGFLVAFVMAIGAVFGALNTMYSAVATRAREIATLRALGFGSFSIVTSFVIESILIALVGGVLGCLAVIPLNGFTAGTMNWQTFSPLAFAFKVTPTLMIAGLAFAAFMGLVGGLFPALRAARLPVATALREL